MYLFLFLFNPHILLMIVFSQICRSAKLCFHISTYIIDIYASSTYFYTIATNQIDSESLFLWNNSSYKVSACGKLWKGFFKLIIVFYVHKYVHTFFLFEYISKCTTYSTQLQDSSVDRAIDFLSSSSSREGTKINAGSKTLWSQKFSEFGTRLMYRYTIVCNPHYCSYFGLHSN